MVSARIARGFGGADDMGQGWDEVFRARRNEPSTSLEWTRAMVRHHGRAGDERFLIRLFRDEALVGVVPLVARATRLVGRPVTILGPLSEEYNTHSDLLLRELDDHIVTAFVDALFDLDVSWDCFRMSRMLEENPLGPSLQRALRARGALYGARHGLPAYFLPLPESFDLYLAARSAKFRNHLKRIDRKLRGTGHVEVFELAAPSSGFDAAYDAMLQVERASWKESHGSSITVVTRQTGFYRDLASAALEAGRLHLQWLCLDGRPIAYNLGYVQGSSYHYLKTSYDHGLRPLSPATFLRARLIAGLIDRGFRTFDFPGEPYEWEAQWTGEIRWRTVLTVYRRTPTGLALYALDRLRHRNDARVVTHIDPRAHGPARRPAV